MECEDFVAIVTIYRKVVTSENDVIIAGRQIERRFPEFHAGKIVISDKNYCVCWSRVVIDVKE
jgi:hypothetical protein